MGYDVWTVKSTGFGRFWLLTCLRGGEKIKIGELKRHTGTDVITINDLPYSDPLQLPLPWAEHRDQSQDYQKEIWTIATFTVPGVAFG